MTHSHPLMSTALALHRQGRLLEAEACYTDLLAVMPKDVAALYQRGLCRLQRGELESGAAAMRQVLKLDPGHVDAHFNLARAELERGRAELAVRHLKQVVKAAPAFVEGAFYLGLALAQLERHAEAAGCFEAVIGRRPELAEAHVNLGSACNELGEAERARACFERALTLRPDQAEAHNGLGNALLSLHRADEAMAHYRQAIALRAGYAEPYQGLGSALNVLGRYPEAAEEFKQAIVLRADFVAAYAGWAFALQEMGQNKAARACWERVLELEPKRPAAHVGLGRALRVEGKYSRARVCYEQALRLDAGSAEAHRELGAALFLWGETEKATAHLEKAVALEPDDFSNHMALLFNLHYHPDLPAAALAAKHRAFGERFEAGCAGAQRPHDNVRDEARVLRVGFVSGDFKAHPVGYFMADLLASLRATGLALYAYANQWTHDALTERIKPQFTAWRECKTLSDEAMAEVIRADAIDILVDLSGHTADQRLRVFARKPAPVQVTYLGYPDGTGLTAMDYILGDPRMLPPGEEGLYMEKPWLLPDTSLCFTPPDESVEVGPLAALQNGFVTFGCLNKREKISDSAVETWVGILHALPDSRLLLQNKVFADSGIADDMRRRFAEKGIAIERVELIGGLSWRGHLETYNRVDIALDPFPYNGTTTSVEGLWMGVPLLTLKGDRLVAHMGESIMQTMGMPEWIAADRDAYVAKAVAFAADLPALSKIRESLRERLVASPICDAPRFARNLEAAFRGMWREWCAKNRAQ